jgi:hypothetical protein
MAGENIVNGRVIKNPSAFKIERYNVTTLQRLANADMAGDLIAKKVKLFYTYDNISGDELDNILEAIWESSGLFFPVVYSENGKKKNIIAYVGSIPTELHRAGRTTNWVWKNVTFNLIQK